LPWQASKIETWPPSGAKGGAAATNSGNLLASSARAQPTRDQLTRAVRKTCRQIASTNGGQKRRIASAGHIGKCLVCNGVVLHSSHKPAAANMKSATSPRGIVVMSRFQGHESKAGNGWMKSRLLTPASLIAAAREVHCEPLED